MALTIFTPRYSPCTTAMRSRFATFSMMSPTAPGVGMIGTGDQVGRETPEENLRAMIDEAGVASECLEWHGHNDFHKVHINGATAQADQHRRAAEHDDPRRGQTAGQGKADIGPDTGRLAAGGRLLELQPDRSQRGRLRRQL